MEILFLGTGTSHGVPAIGCTCETCISNDPKNKRFRSSILITIQNKRILMDASIDLRHQCLRYGVDETDAILFTHHHVDHIFGLDESRAFNRKTKKALPCYANELTLQKLKETYSYIFDYPEIPGGIPMIDFRLIGGPFELFGIPIIPIEVLHGKLPILAYRIGKMVYATDCSYIPESSKTYFRGCDILILDCLRFREHPTHFNFDQALEVARWAGAKKTYFIHISHDFLHEKVSEMLPENIHLAYDGLKIECLE